MHWDAYSGALDTLHTDSMDVYRAKRALQQGVTVQQEVLVATDIPCRLSRHAAYGSRGRNSMRVPEDDQVFPDTRDTYTLFTRSFRLQKGDRVRVLRLGRVVEGVTSDSHPYHGHFETALSVHEA